MRSEILAYFMDGPLNGKRQAVATVKGNPPKHFSVAYTAPMNGLAFDVQASLAIPEVTYARYTCYKPGIHLCNAARLHYIYILEDPV